MEMKIPAKTKIICTIGPATQSVEMLKKLIERGMDVARINFSHGTHEQHCETIDNLRRAEEETNSHVAVLADLQGPKIRTAKMEGGYAELIDGNEFTITTEDLDFGNSEKVGTTFPELINDIKPGMTVLLDDGYIILKVKKISGKDIICEVIKGGKLKDNKGIITPGASSSAKPLSEKDLDDLKLALSKGADAIAMSFVRNARDIIELKTAMKIYGREVPIVAKIEREDAYINIEEILKETDIVMVARGDLGLEMPAEKVPVVQKEIIRKCNYHGKPVIVATQMLESMINNPRPTRAEASDVANAVLDGADAVMLSGETSVGGYPLDAVDYMNNIILTIEESYCRGMNRNTTQPEQLNDYSDSLANASCLLAGQTSSSALICITTSGYTAVNISKYRPCTPILAFTDNRETARRLGFVWGVNSILIPKVEDRAGIFAKLEEYLQDLEYVKSGDSVVFVAGLAMDEIMPQNFIKIYRV